MPVMLNPKGVTLLELLLAVVLVSVAVITMSLIFPKASKSITGNRQRWLANNFASVRIQELKSMPYALVRILPDNANAANFPVSGIAAYPAEGCNCSQENLSGAQFLDGTFIESGMTYTRHLCVHLVERAGGAWNSYCENGQSGPAGADKGLKNIRVRVSWTVGSQNYFTDMESLVTR